MSTRVLADLTDSLVKLFDDQIANQINRAVVLAQLLRVVPGRGQNIQWVARFGTQVGASIADGADVSTFNSDDKVAAVLQYGTYHDAFGISGKLVSGAAAAGNPAELADIFGEELMESAQRLARIVGKDTWDGDGTTDKIAGIDGAGAVDDSGTYAGIDRAVRTQWKSTIVDNSGTPRALSFALMRQTRREIYEASGEKVDLIVCDAFQHEKYGALFGSERRYVQEVRLRGDTIKLDGGYQVLEFDGIPVVEDVQAPAGKMYFLNTRHMEMKNLPQPNAAALRTGGETGIMGTQEEQFGQSRELMRARIQPLAIAGDMFKFALYVYPQVVIKRCNAMGALTDLATS